MTTETLVPGVDALARQVDDANQLVEQNRTSEAIVAFVEIAQRWPSVLQIQAVLCDLYLREGRVDFELPWIRAAVEFDGTFLATFHDSNELPAVF